MSKSSARVALLASFLTFSSLASAQSLQVELRSKCPVTAPAGAGGGQKMAVLAGLLIQQVISKGVDIAGSALAAAAKDKVTTLSGESASATYYTVDEKANLVTDTSVGCVVLFTAGSGGASNPEWMSKVTADMTQLKSVPDFYMEIELEHIAANDGIKATPQMLYVGKSLAPGNGWFRKQGKDYVVAVSLSSEETGASFGAMSFSFKNIDTGKAYVRVQPNGLTNQLERIADWPISARLPKLPESDATKEAASDRKTAIASYVEANGILKRAALTPLVKTPIESNTAYHDMVRKLCDQIAEANKAIPAGRSEKLEGTQQRFSDPRCPLALWVAKLAADKASTEAQVASELAWAQAFYTRKCAQNDGFDEQQKDDSVPIKAYRYCKLPAYKNGQPKVGSYYAGATVVETSEASAFLKSLSAAFNEDKDKVKTALNDKFNPARRDELAAEGVAADRDARQKYQLALLKVSQLDSALQEASGGTASTRKLIGIQLAQAKIDANAAARVAGVSTPFPDFD
jgi:hypothetical protein